MFKERTARFVLSTIFILFLICFFQNAIETRISASDGNQVPQSNNQQKRFPDAVIIGAKKGGTTFLRNVLRMHPNIALDQNEVHFFDKHFTGNYNDYLDLLPYPEKDQIVMEKTPKYWIWPKVPEMLYDINPNMKLILTLRDPACRTISDFFHSNSHHEIKTPDINTTFLDARYSGSVDFVVTPSLYDEHLNRWLKVFPRNQILILKNENMCSIKMQDLLAKIETFLQIPYKFVVSIDEKICVTAGGKTRKCYDMCPTDYECKYKELYPDIYKLLKDKFDASRAYLNMFDEL